MFVITVLVVIGIGVGVLAATVSSSGPTYSLKVLVADVNAMYNSDSPLPSSDYQLAPFRPVPVSEASAERRAITFCNDGRGSQVIAAGLVTTDSSGSIYWAIFVNPPGRHIAISSVILPNPEILNWYAGFVSAEYPQENVFCTFGRAANLPPLATVPEPGAAPLTSKRASSTALASTPLAR